MRLSGYSLRLRIQKSKYSLPVDHLLKHISRSSARNILISKDLAIVLLNGRPDHAICIKRHQRLNINYFYRNSQLGELFSSFYDYSTYAALGNLRNVLTFSEYLWLTK